MGQNKSQAVEVPSGWFIVTGANGSIGSEVVKGLAARGYSVIMACRNAEKGRAAAAKVLDEYPDANLRVSVLDVTSGESISGILNNAGAKFPEFGLTAEGVERTFAINYFGPKALTEALLPHLESGSAVVNTISLTAFLSRLSEKDFRPDRSRFGQLRTYGKSKLAMLQYTRELAVRRPDLRINATDPGIVDSNMITMGRWFDPLADLLFRPICKTPSQGAIPAINAITSPATARYFSGRGSRRL